SVHWRGHVGVDRPTSGSAAGWGIMAPLIAAANGVMFSVAHHVPAPLADRPVTLNPPVLWPLSPKNEALADDELAELLERAGLGTGPAPDYVLSDGPRDPEAPLVVQVSRWDRLKDMHGVLTAFADHVTDAELALIGPDPTSIPDDTGQVHWFGVCRDLRAAL